MVTDDFERGKPLQYISYRPHPHHHLALHLPTHSSTNSANANFTVRPAFQSLTPMSAIILATALGDALSPSGAVRPAFSSAHVSLCFFMLSI